MRRCSTPFSMRGKAATVCDCVGRGRSFVGIMAELFQATVRTVAYGWVNLLMVEREVTMSRF